MTEKNYSPNKAAKSLISPVNRLLAAVANEQRVRPIVDAYTRAILEKHKWPVAIHRRESGCHTVTDPKQIDLLDDKHLWALIAELKVARDAAGLKVRVPDACPLEEAVRDRIRDEAYLAEELQDFEGKAHPSDDLTAQKVCLREVSAAAVLRRRRVARALDLVATLMPEPQRKVIEGLRGVEYRLDYGCP